MKIPNMKISELINILSWTISTSRHWATNKSSITSIFLHFIAISASIMENDQEVFLSISSSSSWLSGFDHILRSHVNHRARRVPPTTSSTVLRQEATHKQNFLWSGRRRRRVPKSCTVSDKFVSKMIYTYTSSSVASNPLQSINHLSMGCRSPNKDAKE